MALIFLSGFAFLFLLVFAFQSRREMRNVREVVQVKAASGWKEMFITVSWMEEKFVKKETWVIDGVFLRFRR